MGQQNTLYTGPMLDVEPGQVHLRPESCVVSYGGVTCFPQLYTCHMIIPPSGNRTSFDPHYLPENHGHLPYVIIQYNGEHWNTFMIPSPSAGVFPVPVNQGLHDHLPFSNNHQIFERNRSLFMDGPNGAFKRKNVEGFPGNFQCFYPAPGSSSSVAIPMTSEGTTMDATSSRAPEHRENYDIRLDMEDGLNGSVRNRATGAIGFDPVVLRNNSHLIHGGQPIQAAPTPWLDQHSATGAFSWNRAHGLPYLPGCINGGGMEAVNMGLHGYQVIAMSRISSAFMHPLPITPHRRPHNLYHHPPPPMPPVQAQNMDIHSQLASTSHRHSTSTTTTANPFQNGVDPRPRFVGSTPTTGLRVSQAHQQESMIESTARRRSFPHLRVLPEDGVAILDTSDYHEVGHLVDHHNYMRLDIDHMSYEELLALSEQVGDVGSGLSDSFIADLLKTRTCASSRSSHPEDPMPADEELNFCVICQTEFDDQEKIGVLDCCHEYHAECIKKWLIVKNTCPICKSTALAVITN